MTAAADSFAAHAKPAFGGGLDWRTTPASTSVVRDRGRVGDGPIWVLEIGVLRPPLS